MDLQLIYSQYIQGTSLSILAGQNSLTRHSLYRLVSDLGLPMKQCGSPKGKPRNKISVETERAVLADFHEKRLPKLHIAEAHKISITAINRILGGRKPRNKLRESADRFRPDTNEAKCIECSEWKSVNDFYVARTCSYGRMSVCKQCQLTKNRAYLYKLTPAQHHALVVTQGNRCAICRASPSDKSNRGNAVLSVDHCHQTGKTRKLLCARCNHTIGLAEDSSLLLTKMANYLLTA